MSTLEKKLLAGTAAFILLAVVLVIQLSNRIEERGGIRALVVEAGKEVKEIAKEINDE